MTPDEERAERRRAYHREWARKRMQDPEYRARHAERERQRRAAGKVDDAEWRRAWRAAHPDAVRAIQRRAVRKYAAANPEKERERRARFRAENPDYWRDRRDKGREYERAYRERHPDVRSWRRRKVARAGILLVVKVEATECGICLRPLEPDRSHPDPLATTIGHEPPLAVAAREGWTVAVERPEHLGCNLWKGARPDAELPAHAATSAARLDIQSLIAAAASFAAPERAP